MADFLTKHPQDWTRPELPQLRDLFVQAYRRLAAAEALADEAGIVPGTFPYYDNMRTIWTELIKVMGLQGKLHTLVEKAAADPASGTYQTRFAEMLEANPTVPTSAPMQSSNWWQGDDQNAGMAVKLYHERLMEQRSRLYDVAIARRVAETSHSVAKLTLNFANERAHGSGFLIQPDLLLTNHHNIFEPKFGDLQAVSVEFDYEEGFIGNKLVRTGKLATLKKHEAHDWAVIQLNAPVDREPIALGTPFAFGMNEHIVIIQHPLGAFKKFALDPLSIRYVDNERIQYVADTQTGSSGSPVFNLQMHVIALHHAEAEVTLQVNGQQEVVWRNEGVRIDRIMEDLRAENIPFTTNQ